MSLEASVIVFKGSEDHDLVIPKVLRQFKDVFITLVGG